MKTYIKNTLLAGAVALGMASCSENSWNDHLDGFQAGPDFSNVQTLDYTLTDADYESIASNSANKAQAESAGFADELAAVKSLHYLNGQITPANYIPNFLTDPNFKYFTLSQGSAINITYRIANDLPAKMIGLNAASQYRVTSDDYKQVYGSDTDYADAFSPSHSAKDNLPALLLERLPDAENGDYAVVQYNNSETDPVFGSVPAPGPDEPAFEESNVLGKVAVDDVIEVNGIVTAICKQGFILTDKGGSILVYFGKSYDDSYTIGQQLSISGKVSVYNYGFQIDNGKGNLTSIKDMGKAASVKYPAPVVATGSVMDDAVNAKAEATAVYVQMTGKLTKSWYEKGQYYNYNVAVEGATAATGSLYQLPDAIAETLEDGADYTFTGYFTSISGGKYYNVLVTEVKAAGSKKVRSVVTRAASIPSVNTYAVYQFNGEKWSVPSDVTVLQPSDYVEMGSNYGNLEPDQAERCIPLFVNKKFPYAAEDDVRYVVYRYYTGGSTVLRCEQYTFTGGKWENTVSNGGIVTETQQFVFKPTGWVLDPSVTLLLPAGKNKPTSMWFYQAVVDWVRDNVPDAASKWCDSYGTGEYYSGCSAYQGNVNINSSYATLVGYYPSVAAEEMVALMKERFEKETGPGALSTLYPNMAPTNGLEPTVTVTFTAWTTGGVNVEYTIVWKCVAKGKFEFVSCTWND